MTDAAKGDSGQWYRHEDTVGPRPEKLLYNCPQRAASSFSHIPELFAQMLSCQEGVLGEWAGADQAEWFSAGWADPSRVGARLLRSAALPSLCQSCLWIQGL